MTLFDNIAIATLYDNNNSTYNLASYIASAPSNSAICILAGIYYLEYPLILDNNKSILGDPHNKTELIFTLHNTNEAVLINTSTNILISNLIFNFSNINDLQQLILITNSNNITFDNVYIIVHNLNVPYTFAIDNSTDIRFGSCSFLSTYQEGGGTSSLPAFFCLNDNVSTLFVSQSNIELNNSSLVYCFTQITSEQTQLDINTSYIVIENGNILNISNNSDVYGNMISIMSSFCYFRNPNYEFDIIYIQSKRIQIEYCVVYSNYMPANKNNINHKLDGMVSFFPITKIQTIPMLQNIVNIKDKEYRYFNTPIDTNFIGHIESERAIISMDVPCIINGTCILYGKGINATWLSFSSRNPASYGFNVKGTLILHNMTLYCENNVNVKGCIDVQGGKIVLIACRVLNFPLYGIKAFQYENSKPMVTIERCIFERCSTCVELSSCQSICLRENLFKSFSNAAIKFLNCNEVLINHNIIGDSDVDENGKQIIGPNACGILGYGLEVQNVIVCHNMFANIPIGIDIQAPTIHGVISMNKTINIPKFTRVSQNIITFVS